MCPSTLISVLVVRQREHGHASLLIFVSVVCCFVLFPLLLPDGLTARLSNRTINEATELCLNCTAAPTLSLVRLQDMREMCKVGRVFDSQVQQYFQSVTSDDFPSSPLLAKSLVCVKRGRVFLDASTPDGIEAYNVSLKVRKDLARIKRLVSGDVRELFFNSTLLQEATTQQRDNYNTLSSGNFYQALGIVLGVTFNLQNYGHLLMDNLDQVLHWMETFMGGVTSLAWLGRDAGNTHHVIPYKIVHAANRSDFPNRTICKFCVNITSAVSVGSNERYRIDAGDASSPRSIVADDDRIHCFCYAALFLKQNPLVQVADRFLGIQSLRLRLAQHFGELPYGPTHTIGKQFLRYGFWNSTVDEQKPRLLLVVRLKSRRFMHVERIVEFAQNSGFNVAAVELEALPPHVQFHLARFADVVAGVHGMALTFAAHMDTQPPFGHCRSLIEFCHWMNTQLVSITFKRYAKAFQVRYERVLPVDVEFGPSVRDPASERVALKARQAIGYWHLRGFDDQSTAYKDSDVKAVFDNAMRQLKKCRLASP